MQIQHPGGAAGQRTRVRLREKVGYGIGDFGFNLYWANISAFLLIFYTDVMGLAAAAVFAITALVPGLGVLTQVCAFVVLAFIAIAIYRQWFSHAGASSDQPLLNRRAEQLIGQVVVLAQPIVGGQGRVQIGDAFWTVSGADLPAGSAVRVVAVEHMVLKVQPA